MRCPPDIADVLIEIIQFGILRIRAFANDSRRCVNEADHIHNLPPLLVDFAPQLLTFYWEVERVLLIQKLDETNCRMFEPLWDQLQLLMRQHGVPFVSERNSVKKSPNDS